MDAGTTILKADNGEKMQEKETLDERLPALFEPDTLLPIQYFEAMRRKHLLEGEKRLILSVLEDAIECFMKCIDASTSKGQRLFRDADEWIAHEDKASVFFARQRLRHARYQSRAHADRLAQMERQAPRRDCASPRCGGPRSRARRCGSGADAVGPSSASARNPGAGCGNPENAQGPHQDHPRQTPPRASQGRQARRAQTAKSARFAEHSSK